MCDGDLNLDYKVNSTFFKTNSASSRQAKDGVLELTLSLVTLALAKSMPTQHCIGATKVIQLGITQVKDGCSKN